ncbi:MAG: DHH family phosphoesterase [Clostridiales bacterium]|jgi:phosphoesterase RecJ-like protein|nr:DHH family phosphoesterase [Clostridiales bacterium]
MLNINAKVQRIAVFSHIRPDGDTLGSMLGLANSLISAGKTVEMFCDGEIPDTFCILAGCELINATEFTAYDMLISVDCADIFRLGRYRDVFLAHKKTLNIDHHITNTRFAVENCIRAAASTCEIVYALIKDAGLPVDKRIAECLYSGILTDTGNFAQNNTTKESHIAAAELIGYGLDIEFLSDTMLSLTSKEKLKLIAYGISSMRFYSAERICLILIRQADLDRYGLKNTETDGIIRYAINCKGVLVGICLTESAPDVFKVSLRSKRTVNIANAAAAFGGGGHKQAAGCVLSGPAEEVIERIVRASELEIPL